MWWEWMKEYVGFPLFRCSPTIVSGRIVPSASGSFLLRTPSTTASGNLSENTHFIFFQLPFLEIMCMDVFIYLCLYQWSDAERLGHQVGPEEVSTIRQVWWGGVWCPCRKQRWLLWQVCRPVHAVDFHLPLYVFLLLEQPDWGSQLTESKVWL